MKIKHITYTLAALVLAGSLTAQPRKLSLDECLQLALENNYSIKIADIDRQQAENNVSPSPFLPKVSLNASQTQTSTKTRVTYTADNSRGESDNTVDNLSVGASVNWTLFDGGAMFATRKRTQQLLEQGDLNLRNAIEKLIVEVSTQYYAIIIQHSRVKAARQYMGISMMRYNQALEKYRLGSISGLEMKQAKIDLNADSSQLITEQENLRNSYISLYEIINIPSDSTFSVQGKVQPEGKLELADLRNSALENNVSIISAKTGKRISENDLDLARALRFPTLNFGAGYTYNYSDNPISTTKYSRAQGLNWGFSLNYTLFNGTDNRRKIRNAKLQVEAEDLSVKQVELNVISTINSTYNSYRSNLQMINFEQESSDAAKLNLDTAIEKYRLGSISGIEFREIQRSYLNAEIRRLAALYQAKVSEITLLYLSGRLLD